MRVARTLEDLAELSGVSRATVSRVINGVPTVDPAIVEVVEKAIDETGYVPNLAARTLVTRRTGSVALVVSEPTERPHTSAFLERLFTDPYIGRVTAGASACTPARRRIGNAATARMKITSAINCEVENSPSKRNPRSTSPRKYSMMNRPTA